jgi:glyoxylase-like metal-dependent hydrolase (beta-lactamase superfamily II)
MPNGKSMNSGTSIINTMANHPKSLQRRTVLQSGMTAMAAMAYPNTLFAQTTQQLTTLPFNNGLTLISGAGANVLTLETSDGIIMVDGGSTEFSNALLELILENSASKSISTLFNTNWRPEHTGANDVLGAGDTQIIAHENTKLWMSNDFTVAWENQRYSPRQTQALPNNTFYKNGRLQTDAETIDYGLIPRAHTDGDIYVFFREANVLAVSDLLTVGSWPILDYATGGWIGGYLKACEEILALADADTLIIPALGLPQTRDSIERQRSMCEVIETAVGQAYASAHSLDEFIETNPAQAYTSELGHPDLFLQMAFKGAWGHIRELGVSVV